VAIAATSVVIKAEAPRRGPARRATHDPAVVTGADQRRAAPPQGDAAPPGSGLARTGADIATLAAGGLVTVALGVVVVLAARRRRHGER